jgi:hypothetical protein
MLSPGVQCQTHRWASCCWAPCHREGRPCCTRPPRARLPVSRGSMVDKTGFGGAGWASAHELQHTNRPSHRRRTACLPCRSSAMSAIRDLLDRISRKEGHVCRSHRRHSCHGAAPGSVCWVQYHAQSIAVKPTTARELWPSRVRGTVRAPDAARGRERRLLSGIDAGELRRVFGPPKMRGTLTFRRRQRVSAAPAEGGTPRDNVLNRRRDKKLHVRATKFSYSRILLLTILQPCQ